MKDVWPAIIQVINHLYIDSHDNLENDSEYSSFVSKFFIGKPFRKTNNHNIDKYSGRQDD